MLGLPKVKKCGQKRLDDDGFGDWNKEIKEFLDRNYEDWQHPRKTYMIPPVFEDKHRGADGNDGEKTEKNFFHLLQEFGEQRAKLEEGMFVIHSYKFKEMITEWNKNQKKPEMRWLLGEHDFVLLHPVKGIVFFQVKAASKTKGKFSLADKQLDKDRQSLHAFAVANLSGKKKKSVDEELHVYPGFVVMPNCARPDSEQTPSNGIFKEDCETVESFANWWDTKMSRKGAISQEVFNCLVMRFVGMFHSIPPLAHFIDKNHRVLALKTSEQLKVMLNSTTEQWITGPVGSGKTWLLQEKVKALAEKAHVQSNGEKILVVCYNVPLSKMLQKAFKDHLTSFLKDDDLESVVDVKTFSSLLYEITGECDPDKEKMVELAVRHLERGASHVQRYDHIFVDESQDLYGARWPSLFDELCKKDVGDDDDDGCELSHKWFFYDTNQYLGLSEERYQQNCRNLKKGTKLSKVLRNTGNVFDQCQKYFKSRLQTGEPVTLGHEEQGLPVKWDRSLGNRQVTEIDGAKSILSHVNKLRKDNVQRKDICVLVENIVTRDRLTSELKHLGVDCQDAEKLNETNDDKVVVESIWRFKGLEAKVVVLYNPRFFVDKDWNVSNVKELLYTAVSRCFCYLIVVTTEEGYKALKSNDGMVESTMRKRQHTSTLGQSSKGLEVERKSQMKAFFSEPYGRGNLDTKYESGPPEYASTKASFKEDDENEREEATPPSVKISRLEEEQYRRQHEKSEKSRLPKRPVEVDNSDIFEPGDPDIKDSIRKQVLKPLGVEVEKNLQYIPGCSATNPAEIGRKIVKTIEYEVYCKFRNDRSSVKYTKELRGLKKEIVSCNEKEQGHKTVEDAVKQAKFNSAEQQAQP